MDQGQQSARDGRGALRRAARKPQGKAPGTRNRATVLRALDADGDEDASAGADRPALGGDPVAARFLIEG